MSSDPRPDVPGQPAPRPRTRRRWWLLIPIAFLAVVVYFLWPARWTFTVSPETTYVTEPLDADGYVDYQTALNQRLSRGISPGHNANVLIFQALGPRPEGAEMPPGYFDWLGAPRPADGGVYFLDWDKYFQTHLKTPPDEFADEFDTEQEWLAEWNVRTDRARAWPWKAADDPALAHWLAVNERPLAVTLEASRRPQYYNPLVSTATGQSARLMNCLLPNVQKCRALANALATRAMSRVGDGDYDGAWQDLMACQRLGRLVGRGASLIEGLVGIALVTIASDRMVVLLSHGPHSSAQTLAWLRDLQQLPPFPHMADKLDLGERFLGLDALMSIACHGPNALERFGRPQAQAPSATDRYLGRTLAHSIDFDPAFRNLNRMYDRMAAAGRLPDRAARVAAYQDFEREIKGMKADLDHMNPLAKVFMGKTTRGENIGNVLMCLILPAYGKILDATDRMEQTQRNMQVAFALAAYRADVGRYPIRLDDLAPKYLQKVPDDVFSGLPLIYQPEGDGYLLYSVGINEMDEDGHWTDDDPPGDDPRVCMPVQEPQPLR